MTAQTEQFIRELSLSSSTQKYLEDKLFNKDIMEKFNIGFCPSSSSFEFDFLNGRLIIPIFNVYGEEIAYAGRRMDLYGNHVKSFYQKKLNNFEGLNRYLKWKQSKWINTPYRKAEHLFNLNNAKKNCYDSNFCFVVEGYFDAIYLTKLGFDNVVALCGTCLTDKQCELIYRYCNTIVLMLDGDDAGKKATVKSVHKARSNNLFAHVVEMPIGKDPDDLELKDLQIIMDEVKNSSEELYIKI